MSIENPKIRRRNFLLIERRKVAAAFNEKLSEGLSIFLSKNARRVSRNRSMISKPSGKNRTSDKHTRDGNKGRLRAFELEQTKQI
jgi:hypothetical protein